MTLADEGNVEPKFLGLKTAFLRPYLVLSKRKILKKNNNNISYDKLESYEIVYLRLISILDNSFYEKQNAECLEP